MPKLRLIIILSISSLVGCAPMRMEASLRPAADLSPEVLGKIQSKLGDDLRCIDAAGIALTTRGMTLSGGELEREVVRSTKTTCVRLKAAFEEKALTDSYVDSISKILEPLQSRHGGVEPTRLTLLAADLSFSKARREQHELAQNVELIKEKLTADMGLVGIKNSWSLRRGILAIPESEIDFASLEAAAKKGRHSGDVIFAIRRSALEMQSARQSFDYTQHLVLPIAARMSDLAVRDFASDVGTAIELLDAEKALFEAKRELLNYLKNYWIARAELEAAAGPLPKTSN